MNPALSDAPFLQALKRLPTRHTPIWVMRQAGRYLPEYLQVRREAGSFLNLCKTPALACEVTLQPIRRFGFDAAILFSDILTLPDAMDLGLEFREGEGPVITKPLRDEKQIQALSVPEMSRLDYVFQAVRLIREKLPAHVPLIGFSGSPYTLACYMIEGHGSKDFAQAKKLMFTRPELFHQLLTLLADTVAQYLIEQIRAGANVVQIFDTWGGLLSERDYLSFSLAYMGKIREALRAEYPDIPVILFTKGGGQWLEAMSDHADALGLDWTVSLPQAFARVGNKVALQGNLDPLALLAPPQSFLPRVQHLLDEVARARENFPQQGAGLGHIFNLGHGIVPQVPPEHVTALVEFVQGYRG